MPGMDSWTLLEEAIHIPKQDGNENARRRAVHEVRILTANEDKHHGAELAVAVAKRPLHLEDGHHQALHTTLSSAIVELPILASQVSGFLLAFETCTEYTAVGDEEAATAATRVSCTSHEIRSGGGEIVSWLLMKGRPASEANAHHRTPHLTVCMRDLLELPKADLGKVGDDKVLAMRQHGQIDREAANGNAVEVTPCYQEKTKVSSELRKDMRIVARAWLRYCQPPQDQPRRMHSRSDAG
ncbi:uncharacterized protein PG986_000818 [Apiospora aurea]|uniref:Uncharacterized protein n=1 Tax=Apiospora aurea TaxID=335848 RepID=A0ABR1QW42_9PEZI